MPKAQRISLSRSCHACAKAKRRCKAGLPKCERCVNKGLECSYLNQPLVSLVEGQPQSLCGRPKFRQVAGDCIQIGARRRSSSCDVEFFYFSQTRAPSYIVQQWCYSGLTGADLAIYEPSLPVIEWRKDLTTVYYLAAHLKAFPLTFSREAKTPFIHSSLYSHSLPKQIKDMYGVCRSYSFSIENNGTFCFQSLYKKVDELIKEYPTLCSFSDLLASFQSLILYLLICLFNKDSQQRRFAEARINILNQWTRDIWEQAPSEISDELSPWQAWAFAESVRRSIITSYLIRGVYFITRFGYHPHSMFVETLPFSRHTWLWDIPSGAEWTSLPPGFSRSIVSYHEYTNEFANHSIHPYNLFETLLLIIRFGKYYFDQRAGIT
ncbi:hypothetical protein GGI42DRAFT_364237 [Trichoderma sp. SZMC 28013]